MGVDVRGLPFVCLLLALAAASFRSEAFAAPSVDVYGGAPDVNSPQLSPDGKKLLMLVPRGDDEAVRIATLGGASCEFAPSNVTIQGILWANSERALVLVSYFLAMGSDVNTPQYNYEMYRFVTIDTKCGDQHILLSDQEDFKYLTGAAFIGRDPNGRFLLFSSLDLRLSYETTGSRVGSRDYSSFDVYRVDLATGKGEKIETGNRDTQGWIADSSGLPRIRIDRNPDGGRRTAFARIGTDWQQVYDSGSPVDEARVVYFKGIADKPDTAYVATRNGGDKTAIFEFDLRSKKLGRLVFQHPQVDVDAVSRDAYSQAVVGVGYTVDYPTAEYFDPTYARMQADLAATFPGEHAQIISASSDRKKFVVFVEGRQYPSGAYHLVDMTEPAVSLIGAKRAAIGAGDVGSVRSFSYQARDGLTIPAFLTLPPQSSGKKLPLVVMPHAGPDQRDDASFDRWAQFLASRGYAVLQPQFRGSSGYGARLHDAGHFKWGLEMQDDLTDGVKHLVADGTADASKVCIVGHDYGGYAAMAGLAFTPDLYRCGVSIAGVSDLVAWIDYWRRRSGTSFPRRGKPWYLSLVGDPASDRERMASTSPINYVARIAAPLLLMHSKRDIYVPFKQSTAMAESLKAWRRPVEFVELQGDDHDLSRPSTHKRILREVEAFLAKHLK